MNFEQLADSIFSIHDALHNHAVHSVNLDLTVRNWLTGRYIIEYEQNGEDRAAYGEYLLPKLEKRLKAKGIKGMTARNLRKYRRLYYVYPQLGQPVADYISNHFEIRSPLETELVLPIRSPLETELTMGCITDKDRAVMPSIDADKLFNRIPCTHLLIISAIDDPLKRVFYELETIRGCWSKRELDHQISSLYYERSGMSGNPEALHAIVNKDASRLQATDIITSPMSLDFLGLNELSAISEDDLEQAILDNIQRFLLELGHGFCFEARQKRILIDEDYFNIDLVFYQRIMKFHFLIELKVDRFRHEYASQLNMYLNYYKNEVMQPDDNLPVGLLLCTDHGKTIVKYATAGMDENLFVRKYMIHLPTEDQIKDYIQNNL